MRPPLLLALAATASMAVAQAPKPLVIVSWDGGADWVVDRLLAEGKLPNVAKLAAGGVAADFMTVSFPSKTATSHFSIFSGTHPSTHGVTGNSVPLLPRSAHTILETRSGFAAESHQAEPLWVAAAKAGKRVLVLSAAGSYPPGPDQERLRAAEAPLDRFVGFSGFEDEALIAPAKVYTERDLRPDRTLTFKVGEQTFLARLTDDPRDPVQGYDTVTITGPGASTTYSLKPGQPNNLAKDWSGPTRVTKEKLSADVYFRLFSLKPDGSEFFLYQRRTAALQGTESPTEIQRYQEAYGGFHDDAFFDVYQRGQLGTTLPAGGDGTAERRLLEIVALDMEFLKRSFRYGIRRWRPDVVFHYSPMSDSAGHTWMGLLDPDSTGYRADIAERLMPFYEQVFQLQDEWLGDMMKEAGRQAAFCLVSDHGMAGATKTIHVNAVLEKAGLLFRDASGRIDLTRTQICAPPWGDFFLIVNDAEWKGGIVGRAERQAVLRRAEKALLDARDPDTGNPIVSKVFLPEEAPGIGIGGLAGGDVYLDFAPGYYPSNRLSEAIVSPRSSALGNGVHGYWPERRKMQAIFYLSGQGVAEGVKLPGMRAVDVAPTLCRLLGIPVPKQMDGQILGGALKR